MAMERGGSSGTRSSPAEDSELWAVALSDPLDVDGMSSSTPPSEIYATYVDHGTMDIQQLLQGPRDEHDLERWLEGAISTLRSSKAEEQLYLRLQLWNQLTSPTNMKEVNLTQGAVPLPATTQPEKQGTCAASTVDLLDCIPKSGWRSRCGLRGRRNRRTSFSTKQMFPRNYFGNAAGLLHDMPSASKGRRDGLRKNNEHWTLEEMAKLVDGVEEYRFGQWTQLKKQKFSGSIRTKDHLKDKWRNLLKAYAVEPTSKKKGNAQRRFLVPLDTTLVERIKKLAAEHPNPKSRCT